MKNKKIRVFKFEDRTNLKNFIYTPDIDIKATSLLVMGRDLNRAFLISPYESKKTAAKITAPKKDLLGDSPHAVVKDDLYIFGGWGLDYRKVSQLNYFVIT